MSEGVTLSLARFAATQRGESIPDDVRTLAKQCILDTIGVALAGIEEPASRILFNETRDHASRWCSGVIGRADRLSVPQAALLNGTAAHALDFDDVHMAIPGHASAVIVPAVLALAEDSGASGMDVVTAIVAGFEVGCRIGSLLSPGHYAAGFHATGTIGAIAAAAACARLLALDTHQTAHAIGIAAAQAAGLKSTVGTMCKPLNAGRAAYNGVLSARLASGGFTSRLDALECEQGFAQTHGPDLNLEKVLGHAPDDFYLRSNIFKFHAACVLTHSPMEALRSIREEHGITADQVAEITVRVDRTVEKVCLYPRPNSPLEAKFSIQTTSALSLLARLTSRPDTFEMSELTKPDVISLRDRIKVDYKDGWPMTLAEAEVSLVDGRKYSARHDTAVDLPTAAQRTQRIREKFLQLALPAIGLVRAKDLAIAVDKLDELSNVRGLARLWSPLE
jgi:2-methylcitrate dehydratase PrpD